MLSVNTNYGAMVALQNLNRTNEGLETTQNRINTGLKIAGPKDNGAVWAIAQDMRMDVKGLGAVTESLNRGLSIVDTAIAAGTSIADLLTEMKEKALAARDPSIDPGARSAYNADFVTLRDQIVKSVQTAYFSGTNLIAGPARARPQVLADADGTSYFPLTQYYLGLGGSTVSLASTATISTAARASSAIAAIETSLPAVSLVLAQLGTDAKKLAVHRTFVSSLVDEL